MRGAHRDLTPAARVHCRRNEFDFCLGGVDRSRGIAVTRIGWSELRRDLAVCPIFAGASCEKPGTGFSLKRCAIKELDRQDAGEERFP